MNLAYWRGSRKLNLASSLLIAVVASATVQVRAADQAASDTAAKQEILASPAWQQAMTGLNEWPTSAERFVTLAVEQEIGRSQLPIRSFLGRKGDVLIWSGRNAWRIHASRTGMPRRSLITHYHRSDVPERAQDPGGGIYALFDHEFV